MKLKDHLLLILIEEGLEVGIECSKSLRFGLHDDYKEIPPIDRIVYEFNDLIGVIELLQENGVELKGLYNREQIDAKKAKVMRLLEYSKKQGRLK